MLRGSVSAPLLALSTAVVAFSFQQTAVIPLLPTVEADLQAAREWTAWLVTGYLVAASVATPLLGRLGDRHGRRRVLLLCLTVFLLGSVGAALAPTIETLIACRLLQGSGGAVFPLAMALAADAEPGRIGRSAGLLTGAFGIGTCLGVGLAGALVEFASWRWVFASGAIVIALSLAAVTAWVPVCGERSVQPLDVGGALLFMVGIGAVLLGLTEPGLMRAAGVPAGLALLALWYRHALRSPHPLIDLAVMRQRTVLAVNSAGFLLGSIMFGLLLLVPYLLQEEAGATPLEVGLYLLPSAGGQIVFGPLAAPLARRFGGRAVFTAGVATGAASAVSLALWHDGAASVLVAMTAHGIGVGLAIGVGSALLTSSVTAADTGVVNALNALMRRVGGSVSGQAAAAVLAAGAGYGAAFAVLAAAGVAAAVVASRV